MLLFVGFIIFCDLVLKLFMIEVKNTINCVKYTLKGITPLNSVIVAIVTYVVLSKLNTKSKSNDINNRTGKVA